MLNKTLNYIYWQWGKMFLKKPIEPNTSNGFCLNYLQNYLTVLKLNFLAFLSWYWLKKKYDLKLSQLFLIQLINFHTFSYTRLWSVVFWKLYIFSIRRSRSRTVSNQNLSMQWRHLSIKIGLFNFCHYWTRNYNYYRGCE